CPHHCLGATLPASGEQFQGAATVRIGAAVAVWPSHRCATMISAEKHVAPSHREATTKACEQGNHKELSQNWRHVRTPMLSGSAAQAPRPASLAGKGGRAAAFPHPPRSRHATPPP